jgi:hypothetical protein
MGGDWGTWAGREADWFEACAVRVEVLDWGDVVRIGPDLAAAVEAVLPLDPPTRSPTRVAGGSLRILTGDAHHLQVAGYSDLDPILLPTPALPWLSQLRGRALSDVVHEARADGVDLSEELLRELLDHRILRADPE